jgi:polyphosphate kinase
MTAETAKFGPKLFINRELSWLEFNHRVLEEALDPANPLLERVKFLSIVASNLDEFFEVRVAGLKQQRESQSGNQGPDGMAPPEILRALDTRARRLVDDQYACWRDDLRPALAARGIHLRAVADLDLADQQWVTEFYRSQVRPVLTPLGIDPSHPFPHLSNRTLNLIVELEIEKNGVPARREAIVQVPRLLPRLPRLPTSGASLEFVFLSDIIGHHLNDLFPGTRLIGFWHIRVTRNSELYIDEEEAVNLLKAVEDELHNRRKGDAVRLEVEKDCPERIRAILLENLKLQAEDLFPIDGPVDLRRLNGVCEGDHSPDLRDKPFLPRIAAPAQKSGDLFAEIRQKDILLHHPFDSFSTVADFLGQAARDPNVLAIKQTLYRTNGDPRIIGALMDAAHNGKQVTAVVELKARFDEENNILWSRRLEEAGVHVVYGLVGYKIHGKMCLVVRKDDDGIRRYLHLSTGNYNPGTARFYTDLGLLTCRPDFGEDAGTMFNLLTGICQFQGTRKFLAAPFDLHDRMLALTRREEENARRGLPARIILKMNALVDTEVIEALYRASQAGVKIDLIIRGTCCLRPGVIGVSENITVRSIVDRFLEHSRVYYFENACQPEVYLGSADWMPRNFFRRIEIVFPVEDGVLRERIREEILEGALKDNVKARRLRADGSYARTAKKGEARWRSQEEFIKLAEAVRAKKGRGREESGKYVAVRLAPSPGLSRRPSAKAAA